MSETELQINKKCEHDSELFVLSAIRIAFSVRGPAILLHDKDRIGGLFEYPEITTQGERLEELEENMKNACRLWQWKMTLMGTRSKS